MLFPIIYRSRKPFREGANSMLDVIFVGVTLALFGLMAAYAVGCNKL